MSGGRGILMLWRNALRDSELDRTAKLVGFVLSTYMTGNGEAFPAKATLAEGAGLSSTRAADGAVDRLEAAGFLTITRTRGRRSNQYRAALPTPHPGAALTPQRGAGLEEPNPADSDAQPRTNGLPTLHGDAPEAVESESESVSYGGRQKRRANARQQREEAAIRGSLAYLDHA